jgi:uncharacterized membrane protein YgdD (TMEM256/DUF423 family)
MHDFKNGLYHTVIMKYIWIILGVFGASAIALAAIGAHAYAAPEGFDRGAFEIAIRYHLAHVVAGAVALVLARGGDRIALATAWIFLIAIMLFSGSIYLKQLAAVHIPTAPLGGVGFMVGWLLLGFSGWRSAYSGRKDKAD